MEGKCSDPIDLDSDYEAPEQASGPPFCLTGQPSEGEGEGQR